MNRRRFAPLCFPILCFALAGSVTAVAASKEIIELQRDVAQLQEQTRLLQQSIDTKMAQLQVLAQQSLDSSNRANASVTDLARSIQSSGADLGKQVVQPMAALGTRIDSMAQDLQALQAGVADQNSRMSKMQQQLIDLKNALSTMPAPTSAAPPPGLTLIPVPHPDWMAYSLPANGRTQLRLRELSTGLPNSVAPLIQRISPLRAG